MRKFFTLFLLSIYYLSFSQTTLVSWNFGDSNATADGGIAANSAMTITENTSANPTYPITTSGTCTQPYILCTNWDAGRWIKILGN
ncbi:MAG: hypothetical protein IPP49_12795 [Saprospiraceae bacterium]|nr:hypothetical protein [Saprospiraceae bacterium]